MPSHLKLPMRVAHMSIYRALVLQHHRLHKTESPNTLAGHFRAGYSISQILLPTGDNFRKSPTETLLINLEPPQVIFNSICSKI